MTYEVNLGGALRPISFSNYCFRRLKKEGGITLMEILGAAEGGDPTLFADVIFYGLLAGRVIQSGGPTMQDVDADKVAVWMDADPFIINTIKPWIIDGALAMVGQRREDIPALVAEDEAAAKKKTTTKSGKK